MWPFESQSGQAQSTADGDECNDYDWKGAGTDDDPCLVDWMPHDARNPLSMRPAWKWLIAGINAAATLVLAFGSSAYVSSVGDLEQRFGTTPQTALLGASLYVVGFAVGPLLWAPLSELWGRRAVFVVAYGGFVVANAAAALADGMPLLAAVRAVGGALGSAAMVNSGGVVADLFAPADRGPVSAVCSAAPFLGPVLGPIAGGFLSQAAGWRGIGVLLGGLAGALWLLYCAVVPETYAPVLLRRRAAALTKANRANGRVFRSRIDHNNGGNKTLGQALRIALLRPLAMLASEAIVVVLSTYMALLYGALYMLFAIFPPVFQQGHGLPPGLSGLAFVGIAVGVVLAVVYMYRQNKVYLQVAQASPGGKAPAEARLPPARLGAVAASLGLVVFALTAAPPVPLVVPIVGTAPFGFGIVVIFLSLLNYLLDTYAIYAASAIAASTLLRSVFGAVFPLLGRVLFQRFGPNISAAVPAALSVLCLPFPFLFHWYGHQVREKARFAQEARRIMAHMGGNTNAPADTAKTTRPRPLSEAHGPTADGELPCYGRFCLGCDKDFWFYCRNWEMYAKTTK